MTRAALHDLRLNCRLVPLVLALAAVAALGLGMWADQVQAHQAWQARLLRQIAVVVRQGGAQDPSLPNRVLDLLDLSRLGAAAAVLTLTAAPGDPVRIHSACHPSDGDGPDPLRLDGQEAPPDLLLSVHGPRLWQTGRLVQMAAPMADAQNPGRLLLIQIPSPGWSFPTWPWLAGAGTILVLASLLGLYLLRRIAAPVAALTERAEALLQGRTPSDLPLPHSAETSRLATVITLVEDLTRKPKPTATRSTAVDGKEPRS